MTSYIDKVVIDVAVCLSKTKFKEFLKGSYVQFVDNGKMYASWIKKHRKFLKNGLSSHYSLKTPYRLRSEKHPIPEILFGTNLKGTWIQLEKTPPTDPGHILDYFTYILTGMNQGPYGSSKYTEHNPMIVRKKL